MRLEEIYKNKPYVFNVSSNDRQGEELAWKILEKIGYSRISNVSFLSSNPDQDTFKVQLDDKSLCFKYSMDDSNPIFSREFEALNQLAPFCPSAEKHGKIKFGEKIQYLVTSFEFAENVRDFGIGCIFENFNSFFYSFNQLQRVKIERSFSQYLKDFFARNNFDNLSEHSRDAIKETAMGDKLSDIFKLLKSEIEHLCSRAPFSNSDFCHGNLQPSNILVRDCHFKFIDLGDCFMGHRFLDVTRLLLCAGLDLNQQKELICHLTQQAGESLEEGLTIEYNFCYNISLRLLLYKIIFEYLVEVYVYESSRPQKLLKVIDTFLRNENAWRQITSIQEYCAFLFNDFMEPVIGREDHVGS